MGVPKGMAFAPSVCTLTSDNIVPQQNARNVSPGYLIM